MMTPNDIDKLDKECKLEAMEENIEYLNKKIKEVKKIEITEEEYKELLDYKYKYLNHQCPINYIPSIQEPIVRPYNPYYPYGQTIYCNKVNGGNK